MGFKMAMRTRRKLEPQSSGATARNNFYRIIAAEKFNLKRATLRDGVDAASWNALG